MKIERERENNHYLKELLRFLLLVVLFNSKYK